MSRIERIERTDPDIGGNRRVDVCFANSWVGWLMANALAAEKSPYLLQHAENPVHWMPWGEAAFARARAEQKPIFLSIGYSTCHWCHVMAHESFENPEIAAVLNEHFVSIKVDREERPDVDKVYMTYVQALTGHGGWPLSAWLTPELKPFYGGTYFPPQDRAGRAGFPSLLQAIARGWRDEREKLVGESERVIGLLREQAAGEAGGGEKSAEEKSDLATAAGEAFEKGFQHFYESFDPVHGGFGGAPKFPRASNLTFLFRCAAQQGLESELGKAAVDMARHTLRAMAQGGIHDHIGGGFHRYSVDERWFVPHFEKMLYDQAQIAVNFLEMKQATGDERYAWLARDIFDYVERKLTSPHGGFYSAEDADSPVTADPSGEWRGASGEGAGHAEGAFYVWTRAEIAAALGGAEAVTGGGTRPTGVSAEAEFFCGHFGVKENGNVDAGLDPHGEFTGKNILAPARSLAESARLAGLTTQQANDRLGAAIEKIRAVRETRPRPHLDDKIITAWNGLMITALARGAQVLGDELGEREKLLGAATRAAEFVERELFDAEREVLFRSWREGKGATEGFAEDYAFFIQGLLDLYEASFEIRWLQWAERLQATLDARFWDAEHGGYFNSAADDAAIVLRLKENYDGAEPAPSSVAAMNLLRLGAVLDFPRVESDRGGGTPATGGESYRERGGKAVEAFRTRWSALPHAMPQLLCAVELAVAPPRHVVIAGDPASADFRALAAVVQEKLGPSRVLLAADGGAGQAWLGRRARWVAEMKPVNGRAAAYVCEEFACQAPVTSVEELRRALAEK